MLSLVRIVLLLRGCSRLSRRRASSRETHVRKQLPCTLHGHCVVALDEPKIVNRKPYKMPPPPLGRFQSSSTPHQEKCQSRQQRRQWKALVDRFPKTCGSALESLSLRSNRALKIVVRGGGILHRLRQQSSPRRSRLTSVLSCVRSRLTSAFFHRVPVCLWCAVLCLEGR